LSEQLTFPHSTFFFNAIHKMEFRVEVDRKANLNTNLQRIMTQLESEKGKLQDRFITSRFLKGNKVYDDAAELRLKELLLAKHAC
jgi:hypothetical protein